MTDARPAEVIMIIRHGEKPLGPGPPDGVTMDGVPDPESLTPVGWARAGALVPLFAPPAGPTGRGLARPTAVFASNRSGPAGGSAREEETVIILAARLGVELNTDYGAGEEDRLVGALALCPGPALVCWKHDLIPAIANGLGDVSPAVPRAWPEDRFDLVWVFVRTHEGVRGARPGPRYAFYQVPELLLPGDREMVIP
jgi:hypothetical protein